MNASTLLAPRDAGKLLDITTSTVAKLDERGVLHAIRDSAGRRLFKLADVQKLAARRAAKRLERERARQERRERSVSAVA